MGQASVENTIKKGSTKRSARQRAFLILNHVTEKNSGEKGSLTDQEYEELLASFKTERDIRTYEKYQAMHSAGYQLISMISQYRLSCSVAVEKHDKYIIMHKNNVALDSTLNAISKIFVKKENRHEFNTMLTNTITDGSVLREVKVKGGELGIGGTSELADMIEDAREEVERTLIVLKSTITAIKDYFSENKFKIKVFSKYIKDTEKWAKGTSGKGFTVAWNAKDKEPIPELYQTAKTYDQIEVDKPTYDHIKQTISVIEFQHSRGLRE